MKCPKCGSEQTRVSNTRQRGDDQIRRQRTCMECRHIWYTIEAPERQITLKDLPPFWKVEVR